MNSESKKDEYGEILKNHPEDIVLPESEDNTESEQELHLLTHALAEHSFSIFKEEEPKGQRSEGPDDVDDKVQQLMEKTKDIRPSKRKIIDFRRWGGLALAATLLIVVTICLLQIWPATLPGKGQRIAYLTSTGGALRVHRDGHPVPSEEAITVLKVGDTIEVGKEGSATILYPEKMYQLSGKKRALLTAQGLQDADDGKQFTPRSMKGRQLAMAPGKLLSTVEPPPKMRALTADVTIMTPRGKVLSRTPPIIWTGDENAERWIAIMSVQENGETVQVRKPIRARGGKVSWEETGWAPLERGGPYAVYIWDSAQERLLSGRSQTLSILEGEEAQQLQANLERVDEMVSDTTTRHFLRANMLMSRPWDCYSEARVEAVALYQQAPGSVPVLKLLQRCYAQLGMERAVKELQKKLDTISSRRSDDTSTESSAD